MDRHPIVTPYKFFNISINGKTYTQREFGNVETVEDFCEIFYGFPEPSRWHNGSFALFKVGIKPVWEDENNAYECRFKKTVWSRDEILELMLSIVGGSLDEACGGILNGIYVKTNKLGIRLWFSSQIDSATIANALHISKEDLTVSKLRK